MRHIVKPLLRHSLMPLLVVLQVALACAIACNALFLLQQKLAPVLASDGISQPNHLVMVTNVAARGQPWSSARLSGVQQSLQALPGVSAASVAASLPMQGAVNLNGGVTAVDTHIKANVAVYIGSDLTATLGLRLVAGRNFSTEEQTLQYHGVGISDSGPTIITRALAQRLFPNGDALGKVIRIGADADAASRTVVGVVAHLMRNDFGTGNDQSLDYTMLFPGVPGNWSIPMFAVRTTPNADVARVRKAVAETIHRELGADMMTGLKPSVQVYTDLRDNAMAQSRAAVWLLAGVSVVVLIVTLIGIMGLTSYWVQQRTRQIGIRRALGARRSHILHELQLENLLVVGAGVLLGLFAAYAINLWLIRHYELTRLPWSYLPYGAALMLLLGQLAVLSPALRAARVPPVVATRTV